MEDNYLTKVVSDLVKARLAFSDQAEKLCDFLARTEDQDSNDTYGELLQQRAAEILAFEKYLNLKEEAFAYLKENSRKSIRARHNN